MAIAKHVYYFSQNQIPVERATNFKWLYWSIKNNHKIFSLPELPHYATIVKKIKAGETVIVFKDESNTFTFHRKALLPRIQETGELKFDPRLF